MWKKINGFDPEVWASEDGQIMQILPQYNAAHGYKQVVIRKHKHSVHRLIAKAFHEKDWHRCHVNHKNGIKHDNRSENLEWCTPLENSHHYINEIKGKLKPEDKIPDSTKKRISNYRLLLWDQISDYFGVQKGLLDCARGNNG
jgi:hypothetical protein